MAQPSILQLKSAAKLLTWIGLTSKHAACDIYIISYPFIAIYNLFDFEVFWISDLPELSFIKWVTMKRVLADPVKADFSSRTLYVEINVECCKSDFSEQFRKIINCYIGMLFRIFMVNKYNTEL